MCRVKELNGRSKASGGDAPQRAEVSTEDSSSDEVSSEPSPTPTSLKSVIKHLQGCKVFEVFHRLLFCLFVLFLRLYRYVSNKPSVLETVNNVCVFVN